ncbi:MAG: Rieske 2Fe-2S domain-containing protein [Pseudomonadota bacterium]
MEHHSQVEHVEQLFAYLDAGGTAMAEAIYENAISTYTCDEQLSVEQDVLFRRSPIVHCLTAEMPNPGDYVTDDFSGVPLLVVRGQDGVVRGFLNVCRHRGARVIDGRGNRRRFSCPYHACCINLRVAWCHPDVTVVH